MNAVSHPYRVQPRFELGAIVATPGALEACHAVYLQKCLARHVKGDWGIVSEDDKEANEAALKRGKRILSACEALDGASQPINPAKPCEATRLLPEPRSGENTLWIITEADRRVTTFLLPDEY